MYFDGISHLLDDGIAVHGLGYACDGLPNLPVKEKAIIGGVQTRDIDGLLPLPIEENVKNIELDKHELLIVCVRLRRPKRTFLPACRGKSLAVRLRWTFPPACRGKGLLMDLSLCLSMKKTYHGVDVRLR